MQMNRPLELGRHIVIVMRTNDNTRAMEFSARVVRCHPLPQGEWQIGGEFSVTLTPEDLDQFL